MAPDPLLKLVAVSKRYEPLDNAPPVEVLSEITLQLGRGDSLAIIGPSGSGKSTLLNIIGTLDQPSSGQVLLDGQDLTRLNEAALADTRNRQIGFIFQSHHLLPQCTVLENVLVPTLASSRRREEAEDSSKQNETVRLITSAATSQSAEERGRELLKRVGLGERLSHRPGQLSGGERQRVAVVRALINNPKLLLADEPTGSLDHASAVELGQLLGELNREQSVTLVVVTHSLELADQMGRKLELREGKLEAK
jgi:ABC-type lipoprotein export system ATPase subunit